MSERSRLSQLVGRVSREDLIVLLQSASIESQEGASTFDLQDALIEKVVDGTIHEASILELIAAEHLGTGIRAAIRRRLVL